MVPKISGLNSGPVFISSGLYSKTSMYCTKKENNAIHNY